MLLLWQHPKNSWLQNIHVFIILGTEQFVKVISEKMYYKYRTSVVSPHVTLAKNCIKKQKGVYYGRNKNNAQKAVSEQPLFTGNYIRDNSITEFEKFAEASEFIWGAIKKLIKKYVLAHR